MKKLLFFGTLVAVGAYLATRCCHKDDGELFLHPETTVWGNSKEDPSIKPYTFKVDPKDIDDLKRRLATWRRHEPMAGVGSFYGFAGERLDNLVKYWREKYDFTKFESRINSFPQFTTVIQGLTVHFIHAKADPKATKKIPLLISHGWPGSVVEFHRAIPLLTAPGPDGVAFDVVAPSIPGFAFSEAAIKPGFSALATAQVYHALMQRLNYKKFIYQGGDWGSVIGRLITRVYPDSIIGFHANLMPLPFDSLCEKLHMVAAFIAPGLILDASDADKIRNYNVSRLLLEESGYFHEQATKPDTVGVALSDSPVGLLSWIAEKFEAGSENAELKGTKGGISNDDLLTDVMVYWFTNHVTSAGRFYKEFVQDKAISAWSRKPITVPTAVACYPNEIPCSPKALLKHSLPRLVHYVDQPQGGHFAALEVPEPFVKDFRAGVTAILAARAEDEQKEKDQQLKEQQAAKEQKKN